MGIGWRFGNPLSVVGTLRVGRDFACHYVKVGMLACLGSLFWSLFYGVAIGSMPPSRLWWFGPSTAARSSMVNFGSLSPDWRRCPKWCGPLVRG
jgi:hypothetical protein